ncbi:hypothetical protein LFL96_21110 [Paraburkholderia sp. D15]|uniref:hypothetical protein n=1 Tax=Paraburkholderia sp. D15 TaxID=2880218 RepID=UPI002478AD3A|nr:hypothetical protein [Paraburkholderia sp. D15]WGS53561.1 hypothetical protein LFL96_21110 [Paraburkholderia sp. D15]
MTQFLTRVELYDSEDADYEDLHEQMAKRGFKRTIVVNLDDDTEHTYQLPRAEYLINGDFTRKDVYDKGRSAVNAIKKRGGVVVTQSSGIYVGGLKKAKSTA